MEEHATKATEKSPEEMLTDFYRDVLQGQNHPSVEYQKKYLLQLLNAKIAKTSKRAMYTKLLNYLLNISVMFFSAATTILLGLQLDETEMSPKMVKNVALIISAVITFLGGLAIFWDIQNYWIRNKVMLSKLKEIRYEYVFHLAGDTQMQTKDLRPFLNKFLACLGDEYWEKFLKDIKKGDAKNDQSGNNEKV